MEAEAVSTVAKLEGWRETIERLGIGGLIVVCIFILLWKSGSFLGPLLTELFKRFYTAADSVTKLNGTVETLANKFGDGVEKTQRHSAAIEAAVEFAGEFAINGKLPEERVQHHVDRVKEILRP